MFLVFLTVKSTKPKKDKRMKNGNNNSQIKTLISRPDYQKTFKLINRAQIYGILPLCSSS